MTKSFATALSLRDYGAIADWFVMYFFGFGTIGLLSISLAAGLSANLSEHPTSTSRLAIGLSTSLLVLSFGSLFSGACTVCGWLLGLLFGIPRVLARPQPNGSVAAPVPDAPASSLPNSHPTTASRVNTNLEDISDWLTKTIVGVGLTQLFAVPRFIWHVAAVLARDLGWFPSARLLILVLFLYFLPGGFWLGYVTTRTLLTRLFDQIDLGDVAAAGDPVNLQIADNPDQKKIKFSAVDPSVSLTDTKLLQTPLPLLRSARDLVAWGAAQARAGNLSAAATAFESAVLWDPSNATFKDQLGKIYSFLDRHWEADEVLKGLPESEITVYNALYAPPPQGFERAIGVGERLASGPTKASGNLYVWLACAYGQKFEYQKTHGASELQLSETRDQIIKHVKNALSIAPSSRDLIRSLWKPPEDAKDRDLAALDPNDPDLTKLLGP